MTEQNNLVARILRLAEASPPGNTIEVKNQDSIVKKLENLIQENDNLETLATYLEELSEIDASRTEDWLSVLQANFSDSWEKLVFAADACSKMGEDEENVEPKVESEVEPEPVKPAKDKPELENVSKEEAEQSMVSERVVGFKDIQADGEISLALFNTDVQNPHYAVFYNGKPLAEIKLANQERPDEIRDAFMSDEYAKNVAETCQTMGVKETLDALKANYYISAIEEGTIAARAASVAETNLEEQYADRLAALKENFLNTIQLAITASNKGTKGLFVENNLKQQLKDSIRRAGVVNPGSIIDEVWNSQASTYFDSVLTKAEEWMGYTPEALAEVSKEILGSAGIIEEDPTVEETRQAQAEVAARGEMQNIPLITSSFNSQNEENDLRSHYRKTMQFRNRFSMNLGTRH